MVAAVVRRVLFSASVPTVLVAPSGKAEVVALAVGAVVTAVLPLPTPKTSWCP